MNTEVSFEITAEQLEMLTEFASIVTEGMPEGYVQAWTADHKVGLFSLKTGGLVLPAENRSITNWGNGFLCVQKDSEGYTGSHGIFSLERGEFVLPIRDWLLRCSPTNSQHVLVEGCIERFRQVGGIFSLETGEWLLPLEQQCMFGSASNRNLQSQTYDGEEFVVIHNVETRKLGLFSFVHGMIFEPIYKFVRMGTVENSFVATAEREDETKECLVVSGGQRWMLPTFTDICLDATPPHFILQHMDGWCLYIEDAKRRYYGMGQCDRIFRHKDCYVGVSEETGSDVYNPSTGESRCVSGLILEKSVTDDRWIARQGKSFGVYDFSVDATLIPPVFEELQHIHGDLYFARWQGKSMIIDLAQKELWLPVAIGVPIPETPIEKIVEPPVAEPPPWQFPRSPDPDEHILESECPPEDIPE